MSFAELLSKARHHDREAVATLYRRALPVMYRYVYAHLGQPDLVEDVVSEVFLVMVESIEQLRTEQEAGFYAWLIQIAHRKVARAIVSMSHPCRRIASRRRRKQSRTKPSPILVQPAIPSQSKNGRRPSMNCRAP